MEFVPKPRYDYASGKSTWRPNLFAPRVIPPGALIHQSAYLRGDVYLKTIKLPDDVTTVRHEICGGGQL
jgi:hypothetical protein